MLTLDCIKALLRKGGPPMSSFTQIINFIMGLIDLLKNLFNGSQGDDQQPDDGVIEE